MPLSTDWRASRLQNVRDHRVDEYLTHVSSDHFGVTAEENADGLGQ